MYKVILIAVGCIAFLSVVFFWGLQRGLDQGRPNAGLKHVSVKRPTLKLESITIMTFNVGSLFDAKDDQGTSDQTYLPLKFKNGSAHRRKCKKLAKNAWQKECLELDWSSKVIRAKLKNIGAMVRQVNNGLGPDFLLLQEVENIGILKRLKDQELASLGYKHPILIEGQDYRGIDVAILAKHFLKGPPKLTYAKFPKIKGRIHKDGRGILQADFFLPDQTPLTVFVVHFPAPFLPKELRQESLRHLDSLLAALPVNRLAIVGGDFNITAEEDREFNLLKQFVRPNWIIAHQLGCGTCQGTYYYGPKDSWSFLDMLLVSRSFKNHKRWEIDEQSVRVLRSHAAKTKALAKPMDFSPKTLLGVSDHWPLVISIVPLK